MSRRPFKNALCLARTPMDGGWMNPAARKSCRRYNDHVGPCRNSMLEWDASGVRYRDCGHSISATDHERPCNPLRDSVEKEKDKR